MSRGAPEDGVVVIFDIDGTLLDSVAFHHHALLSSYEALGVGVGSRSLSEFPHYTDSAIFSQLVGESRGGLATAGELARLDEHLEREYARLRFSSSVSPIAGARALLRSLGEDPRFEISFATGAMRRPSLQKLRLLEVDVDGALITTASEFQTREQIVTEAVRLAAARRRQRVRVISIGDGVWDQRTAERLSIPFLAVESGTHTFGREPVLRVPDLASLTPDMLWHLSRDLVTPSAPAGTGDRSPPHLSSVHGFDPDPQSPPRSTPPAARAVIGQVASQVDRWRREHDGVLVVAVDGHGASGKTTIARGVAATHQAALLHTDDFFRGHRLTGAPDALPLADYYDWDALRGQALEPLRAGRPAEFPHRHWEQPAAAGTRITLAPRAVVVLEGVTAAGPALADLVDRRVLVATPEPERLRRLHGRIPDDEWDADWLVAEQAYLDSLPPRTFDLTVPGTTAPIAAEKG